MKNAVNLWITPEGREHRVPDAIWAQAKFTKTGALDKRADNSVFSAWLAEEDAKPAEVVLKEALAESMRLDPPDLMKLPVVEQAPNSVPHINGDTGYFPEPKPADELRERAQAYAMRIWACQSVDVGRGIRIARCKLALEGQNLPADGVVYPESV